MLIESVHDNTLKTLNLGCFPGDVLQYQDSQEFFQQLVFIDYQLQLLIENEFDGNELVPTDVYHYGDSSRGSGEKLQQLIAYAELVANNYNDINKDYQDKLYCAIILAHLYFLNSQTDLMHELLNSITVRTDHYASPSLTVNQNNFLNYLICRYNALIGIVNSSTNSYKLWLEYLFYKEKPFNKTEVAANHWLEILFKYLSLTISNNGVKQLSFEDVSALKFHSNKVSFIRYCNFLINFKLEININKIVDKNFRAEYSQYLNHLLIEDLKLTKKHFPNADESNDVTDDFVDNLYSTLGSKHKKLINLNTSKNYLVGLTERTYQSQIVLGQLIKILLDLNEYDEAFVAFKTYISYVEKEEQITHGDIHDIITIIEIFSICIHRFNPLNSSKGTKFKYITDDEVVKHLIIFSEKLQGYLEILKRDCHLSYDDDEEFRQFEDNRLSFLYNKYNTNILLNDKTLFIQLLSSSWFSIGYLYYYLLIRETPNYDAGVNYRSKLLKYYKNSLIINSTGNLVLLFNYALALSYFNDLNSSIKLCKFILKKYPESFRTWNLLSLIASVHNPKDAEKFINNSLNIAGIYIIKCKNDEVDIPVNIKHDILQLKLTQLAIWEKIYGTPYIMEYLSEVFILFYELFNIKLEEQIKDGNKNYLIDSKWSHRPSFIDPKFNKDLVANNSKRQYAKNNIKKISKINHQEGELKPVEKTIIDEQAKIILQNIWLWTSKIYFKVGLYDESELCIIEGENVYKPNIKTFIALGYLTSKQAKFLSLQEFEKSLEKLEEEHEIDQISYLENILGLCKLFLVDDTIDNSLFISDKDLNCGLIRLKNYLERFLNCWPIGFNSIEVWYYLSLIYEKFDDKVLLNKSLNKCIELENLRPVRNFFHCDDNI